VVGLGEGRERSLNEAVAAHCSRAKLGAKSSQAILDLMEARLNKFAITNLGWSKIIRSRRTGAKMTYTFWSGSSLSI
jgi:hypothetical protein